MQIHADHAQGVFDAVDSQSLHRIYACARRTVGDRIVVDEEIERRLAVIVLFAYGAATRMTSEPAADEGAIEGAIVRACVDRLMANTTAA